MHEASLSTRANISFKKNVDHLIIYIQHCTSLIEIHKENLNVSRIINGRPLLARENISLLMTMLNSNKKRVTYRD